MSTSKSQDNASAEEQKSEMSQSTTTSASQERRKSAEAAKLPGLDKSVFEVFGGAILHRRQQSFNRLREWEQKRAVIVNDHRAVSEEALGRLNHRIDVSINTFEDVTKFLTERQLQEEHYHATMNQALPTLRAASDDKTHSGLHSGALPAIFKECDDFHMRQSKSSLEIAQFIQKKVLKDAFGNAQKDFVKTVTGIRENLNQAKHSLNTINAKMQKKTQKYSSIHNDIMKVNSHPKKKDVYNKELSIMSHAHKQIKEHENFGKEVFNLWEKVHKLELDRYKALKKGVTMYLSRMAELYGKSFAHADKPLKSFESFNYQDEVARLYHLKSILEPSQILTIKKAHGVAAEAELTLAAVKEYFTTIEYEKLDSKPLVVKEWKCKRDPGLLKGFKPCFVYLTVDSNLLIVDKNESEVAQKANNVIKMKQMNIRLKDDHDVEIVETIPGLIMNTTHKHTLRFDNKDDIEMLFHQVQNYRG